MSSQTLSLRLRWKSITTFDFLSALICAVIIGIIFYRAPLSRSLWTDETVSAWITSGTLGESVSRSWEFQGQSPLYFVLLWSARQIVGSSELALRGLSIFSLFLTLVFLISLARKVGLRCRPDTMGIVLLSYLSIDAVLANSISARPYSLALLASVLLLNVALSMRRASTVSRSVIFWFLAAGVIYFHYLFTPLVVFALGISWGESSRAPRRNMIAAIGILSFVVLLIPAAMQLSHLCSKVEMYSFAPPLSAYGFLQGAVPFNLFFLSLFSAVAAWAFSSSAWRIVKKKMVIFMVVLALLPSVGVALGSLVVGQSLFVSRYFLYAGFGFALLVGSVQQSWVSEYARRIFFLIFAILTATRELDRVWHIEDWRVTLAHQSETPVLLYTGLVESSSLEWISDPARYEYFAAPTLYYPTNSVVTPIGASSPLPIRQQALRLVCLNDIKYENAVAVVPCREIKRALREGGYREVARRKTGLLEDLDFQYSSTAFGE